MPAAEADIFQVYFRTPQICMSSLHWLSGNAGLYVEPRSTDGRSTDPAMAVIWLPGSNLTEAMHKQKTIEKTLPVTRFGSKYGVRVLLKDEAQIRAKMGAAESQPRILVQQIYEMRPLPHGTTRKGLWTAKPVQPGRADASGMSWKVGAEAPPPAPIVQTSTGDVTISLQKQVINDSPIQRVFGSTRTQAHLRREHTRMRTKRTSSRLRHKNQEQIHGCSRIHGPNGLSDPEVMTEMFPCRSSQSWSRLRRSCEEKSPMWWLRPQIADSQSWRWTWPRCDISKANLNHGAMKLDRHNNTCKPNLGSWRPQSQSIRLSCQTWGGRSNLASRTSKLCW